MLRPSLALAVVQHCADALREDNEDTTLAMLCKGVFITPVNKLFCIVGTAPLSSTHTHVATEHGLVSDMLITVEQDDVDVVGPSSLFMPHEWEELVQGVYEGLRGRDAVSIAPQVWVADTQASLACLLLSSAVIRDALVQRGDDVASEAEVRAVLQSLGSDFPQKLDALVDAEVAELLGEVG